MPVVSSFYGIKIYIYWNDDSHRHVPHFHAFYGEFQAAFSLNGDYLSGRMPITAQKLIKTWAVENYLELCYAWDEAIRLLPVRKIKGLI